MYLVHVLDPELSAGSLNGIDTTLHNLSYK